MYTFALIKLQDGNNIEFTKEVTGLQVAEKISKSLSKQATIISVDDELKDLKVNIKLISDGDVLGALYVSDPKYNVDMFLGIGGGPEGVLAACALDTYNCHFQGRFIFDNEKDKNDAKQMGINDFTKKYELREIIKL